MASPSRCRSSSPRGKGSGWTRGKGSIWNGPSRPVGPPVRVGRRRSGARKLHGMPTPGLHPGVRLSLRGRKMRSATRLDSLGTEQAYLVLGAARRLEAAGHEVVHLEIGEPDMPTPPHVVEAGVRALRDGLTRYALAAGVPELRDAIARSLAARGVRATAENVVVTPGAKPALFCTALSVIEPGDEVLCPDPGFPIYESVVRFTGGRPVYYPLDERREFAPHVGAIAERITPRTRVLILNVPHNPTGGLATARACTATFVQYAGIAALTGPQDAVTRMVAGLRTKRDLLVHGLNAIDGINCASPAGAFYCFPDISGVLERTGLTCKSFAKRLLAEQFMAVLAGTAFGPGGEGHLRLCYATEPAELERALERIRAFVSG